MLPCSMKTSDVQWNIKTQLSVLEMRNNQVELWSFSVSMLLYNTSILPLFKKKKPFPSNKRIIFILQTFDSPLKTLYFSAK